MKFLLLKTLSQILVYNLWILVSSMLNANKSSKQLMTRTICCQETVIPDHPPNVCIMVCVLCQQRHIVYRKRVYELRQNPWGNIFWHFHRKLERKRKSSLQVNGCESLFSVRALALPQCTRCEPAIIFLVRTQSFYLFMSWWVDFTACATLHFSHHFMLMCRRKYEPQNET